MLQPINEALLGYLLVLLKDSDSFINLLKCIQELIWQDNNFDFVYEGKPHDCVVWKIEIHDGEANGHGFTVVPFPNS